MALARVQESDEEEEYHSLSGHEPDNGNDDESGLDSEVDEPPVHPVRALQGAFEESIKESTEDEEGIAKADAKGKPGSRHHPLMKTMANIVFGLHLLYQQQAKSNEEVIRILQTHVNEIDSFLERTGNDFNVAINDIAGRVRHLKLPMDHLDTFNTMLDDKIFRTQLIEGNDRIEIIIERTAKAMNAALMDVKQGLKATRELGGYLDSVKSSWPREKQDLVDVFGAMRGNERGWLKYLNDLQAKGRHLRDHLIQLGTVIAEMSKLAAAASRRNRPQSRQISPTRSAPVSPGLRSKFSNDHASPVSTRVSSVSQVLNKPLPSEPRVAAVKMHPVPFEARYESPRASPYSPTPRSRIEPDGLQRPKTAGHAPRDARVSKSAHTKELAEFLRTSGPLRSNPPEAIKSERPRSEKRAKSHGANDIQHMMSSGTSAGAGSDQRSVATFQPTGSIRERRSSSRPRTRGGESAMSVRSGKSAPDSRKDSGTSSGFARRISMRMKHLPPSDSGPLAAKAIPEELRQRTQAKKAINPVRQPTDLAYTLDPDDTAPVRSHTEPITPPERPVTAISTATATQRPPSRLGIFPRSTAPPRSSGASITSNGNSSLLSKGHGKDMLPNFSSASAISTTPRRTGRMASVKNMFSRKH